MKVKDVMHSGAVCLDEGASVREVARKMREADIGAIPIRADGKLVGIITDRDIACRAVADGVDLSKVAARDVMSKEPICCELTDDLPHAVHVMETRRIRRLPVMANGAIVGMLSLGDISNRGGGALSAEVLKAVSGHH